MNFNQSSRRYFTHADNSLFQTLMLAVNANHLEMFDVIPVDQNIRNLCFSLMRTAKHHRYNLAKCEAEGVYVWNILFCVHFFSNFAY